VSVVELASRLTLSSYDASAVVSISVKYTLAL